MIDLTKSEGIQTENGIWAVRLALTGAVFADLSEVDLTASLLKCLDRFISIDGVQLSWLRNPRTNSWSRFDIDMLSQHRAWIEALNPDQPFELAVSNGETWKDAAENFCAIVRAAGALRRRGTRSYLRFSLSKPVEETTQESAIAFMLDVASTLHADSGWSGLGLVMSPDKSLAASFFGEEFATAQRFEGIDVGSVAITSTAVKSGIKGVNWLTVLGGKWLDDLGGYELLSAKLAGLASVIPFGNGAIVRAGANPVLGDRNRGEPAHLYHSVGRVLASVRTKRHGRFHKLRGPHYFGESETLDWLARFDEE